MCNDTDTEIKRGPVTLVVMALLTGIVLAAATLPGAAATLARMMQ